jgi:hypothetical protein
MKTIFLTALFAINLFAQTEGTASSSIHATTAGTGTAARAAAPTLITIHPGDSPITINDTEVRCVGQSGPIIPVKIIKEFCVCTSMQSDGNYALLQRKILLSDGSEKNIDLDNAWRPYRECQVNLASNSSCR